VGRHTEGQEPPPTFPWAQQRKKRERHLIGVAGLVLGGLFVCGCLGFGFGLANRSPDKAEPAGPEPTIVAASRPAIQTAAVPSAEPLSAETVGTVAHPGAWLTDGVMQYVVAGQKCGVNRVGPGHGTVGTPENGQFCVVNVRIRNRSKQPLVFAAADQIGYSDGVRYAADPTVTKYANGSNRTFLTPLAAFQVVAGELVFDLPDGVRLTDVRLRSSTGPSSVTVRLV
jgi:hypothetical protein